MSGALVYVGVYLAELSMPWVRSLKEKRALVKPVTERLKVRFPVSVARLDGLDAHDWERIGAVAIHHDPVWLEHLLADVHGFVLSHGDFRVQRSSISVEVWDAEVWDAEVWDAGPQDTEHSDLEAWGAVALDTGALDAEDTETLDAGARDTAGRNAGDALEPDAPGDPSSEP